jgi:hypothetical protein
MFPSYECGAGVEGVVFFDDFLATAFVLFLLALAAFFAAFFSAFLCVFTSFVFVVFECCVVVCFVEEAVAGV